MAEDDPEIDPDDPTDPSHPDYDLSEAVPYSWHDDDPKPWLTRRGVMLVVAVLLIVGMLLPSLIIIF